MTEVHYTAQSHRTGDRRRGTWDYAKSWGMRRGSIYSSARRISGKSGFACVRKVAQQRSRDSEGYYPLASSRKLSPETFPLRSDANGTQTRNIISG